MLAQAPSPANRPGRRCEWNSAFRIGNYGKYPGISLSYLIVSRFGRDRGASATFQSSLRPLRRNTRSLLGVAENLGLLALIVDRHVDAATAYRELVDQ